MNDLNDYGNKKHHIKALRQTVKAQASILGGFVAIIWLIQILNSTVLNGYLLNFGIVPDHAIGLRGIIFAPFLHGNFGHVASNTVPFLILGWLVMLRGIDEFFFVSIASSLVSGLGTWLIGNPNSVHIGASGMIFGYLGFLLWRGWFERSITSIAIAVIVGLSYGGLIFGVLPTQPGVSWEGHLFGFIGGIVAARLLAQKPKRDRHPDL